MSDCGEGKKAGAKGKKRERTRINMVSVLQPGCPWQQAASACFTLAGWFSDILIIRIFLFLAYVWLLTASVVGFPRWPEYQWTGSISVDGICWAVCNILVHGAAIASLLLDERRIRFKVVDEQQLFRFLYRRGGFEPLEAREVIRRGQFRTILKGDVVSTAVDAADRVVLLIEGKALYQRSSGGTVQASGTFLSGMIWDLRMLSIFGVYVGFEKEDVSFTVDALEDCLIFEWTLEKLDDLSAKCGPSVSGYFRNFILCQIAFEMEFREHGVQFARSTSGVEDPEWIHGARSKDFTEPISEEAPSWVHQIKAFCVWIGLSFTPVVPSGIRHTGLRGLPRTGLAARRRLMALHEAHERKKRRQKSFLMSALHRLSSHFDSKHSMAERGDIHQPP